MRLWSLHPCYLDSVGLIALWREALLAQKVLEGETEGYRNHPQLVRFRSCDAPLDAIASYLEGVYNEANARGFRFNRAKIGSGRATATITVSSDQLLFETEHLRAKLKTRNPAAYARLRAVKQPQPHPLFSVAPGPVETWETVRP